MKKIQDRIKGRESVIKVAAVQMNSRLGDKEYNLKTQVRLIEKAVKNGASLIVLPELVTTGYRFNTRQEVAELAEPIPDGSICRTWIEICQGHNIYICGGLAERDGDKFYNSAALVGPGGLIGKYRKIHLWDEERLFFELGDLGLPVFHLPF
ncbi:MAG: nitrilase-related carbon-nitrogen hydrolase, partial [Pseudomonadota bacterium]